MGVTELGHIVLYVENAERSAHFYRDVLGWHHELLLIEVGEGAQPIPGGRRLGMYHFGLKVGESDDELRAALERVRAAGATVLGSSDHHVTHSLYIADPDGNEVELFVDVPGLDWQHDPALLMTPTQPLRL
jgi:catechol 2,3-dioxygenase